MLGLKLLTDPRWANIAESNLEEILSDHAWCEQKAASNAIFLITNNPEHTDLIQKMAEIAMEEMDHFNQVIEVMKQRGYTLIPLRVYLKAGRVKLELGLAKGKATEDRREEIKEREGNRGNKA